MNKKVLIIFKYPRGNWNANVVKKFLNYYDTEYLYISDYKDMNFTDIVKDVNYLIKEKDIEIVLFDVDYFKFINLFFIQKINAKKKLLWTGDDFELHEMNSITASACDLVLSHCPLSVLKYKEKGYQAYTLPGENGKINKTNVEKKEIDVLFFGALTEDRIKILNYLQKEGINLKNVGHVEGESGLPEEELLNLISKSKIIINFSKSRTTSAVSNYGSEKVYKFYYQFKGRIMLAGLNGALCVSEYSPGQELLFKDDEIPIFYTKEECLEILKKLLENEDILAKYTDKFCSKVHATCEDKKSFEPIYNSIEKLKPNQVKLFKIPYWYLRIVAKQTMLRNIKLSTFLRAIFQFNLIFQIVKNSNFLVKFLILSEAIINVFWYSLILTFKAKK